MLDFGLQFWCKLNIRRNVKTCPCHFLLDYYSDSLMLWSSSFLTIFYYFPWYMRMFPIVFLLFLWVLLQFSLRVSLVSCFRFCAKKIYLLLFCVLSLSYYFTFFVLLALWCTFSENMFIKFCCSIIEFYSYHHFLSF